MIGLGVQGLSCSPGEKLGAGPQARGGIRLSPHQGMFYAYMFRRLRRAIALAAYLLQKQLHCRFCHVGNRLAHGRQFWPDGGGQ